MYKNLKKNTQMTHVQWKRPVGKKMKQKFSDTEKSVSEMNKTVNVMTNLKLQKKGPER